MSENETASGRLNRVREVMRGWESEPQTYDPDLAQTYAGQWVVLHRGQVVAHASKGSDLVQAGELQKYPGALLTYVPTKEQQEGVWLLPLAGSDL